VLFSAPVAAVVGAAGAPLYVASTVVVLAAVLRNLEQPWFRVIAFGAALNLLAIVSHGGVMPADQAALVAAGLGTSPGTFSNTAPSDGGAFAFLGDLWVTPAWLPFRNAVSVGDVLIGSGAAAWLASVMLRGVPASRGSMPNASLRLGKRAA